ncbi:hypothetical protein EDD17DRAFT_1511150 [Pisolithus thermaeus]|nr:hypothetical protein EDD17DRAFT_1511150 [Pisolithus thermaeus]
MNEKRTSLMPHHQICNPTMLRGEMRMTPARFREFTSLTRFAAKRHLNCGLRPEQQDPDRVQKFMTMDSKRGLSQASFLTQRGEPQQVSRSYLGPAKNTGAPFKRNFRGTRAHCEPKEQVKMRKEYLLRNRLVAVKKPCMETNDSEDGADSQTDSNTRSASPPPASRPCSVVRASTDPELDFLSSAKSNLADFHPHFVALGLIDDNTLKGFFSWKADEQERMMRQELGHVLTPLQLYGLFVAMRERRELLRRSLL